MLSRIGGLLMTAPIYGSTEVPVRIRGLLAFSLALLITPLQTLTLANQPQTLVDFGLLVAGEIADRDYDRRGHHDPVLRACKSRDR